MSSAAPLRIALVSLHTSPADEPGSADAGGMNVVVRHQAAALAAAGHDVEVLTRRASSCAPADGLLAPGVTLRLLDAGPPAAIAKGDHEEFIDEFGAAMRGLGPYDVIHSHHWFSGMAALPVARAAGTPHVQSFHSIAADDDTPLSEGERAESAGRMAGEAELARSSDALVAISHAEADTITGRLGGDAARVSIVPPGVDADTFHPAPRPDGRPIAVVAGRLQPLKGVDLAIDAVAAMDADLRPRLVVVGDVSLDFADYADELRARADAAGVGEDVDFVGPRSRADLAALLASAAVVLVPSHSETYGLVALEAASCGAPVVAAAAGGLSEAVIDGVTGVVLADRTPDAWAQAISDIVADPDIAAGMGAAGRRHAEHRSWEASAAALADVYASLAAAGVPEPSPAR